MEEVLTTEEVLDGATPPKKKRIWEIDFLRGFMILFVIWDHFMWDVDDFARYGQYNTALFQWLQTVANKYYSGVLRETTHDTFVMLFVLTSGISCSFSKNNLIRAVKMIIFAILLTVITGAFGMPINFNVIHVVALSVLIYSGLEALGKLCKKPWQKAIYGWCIFALTVFVLVFGYSIQYVVDNYSHLRFDPEWIKDWVTSGNKTWFFLYQHVGSAPGFREFWGTVDYLAFLPAFGWFLLGASLGKFIYKDKTTLFPSFNEKIVSPITFCGRYSIWVYFGSQGLMYSLFYLFKVVLA